MPELICDKHYCDYYFQGFCKNKSINKEFEDLKDVSKVKILSCNNFHQDEDK